MLNFFSLLILYGTKSDFKYPKFEIKRGGWTVLAKGRHNTKVRTSVIV